MQLRFNSYLRAVAPLGRETDHVGPFVATCTTGSDNLYLNYAIPEDGASPQADDVQGLINWYVTRDRKPRLEYVTSEAPEVEVALLGAGFSVESRLPLMVWDSATPPTPAPVGIELLLPESDDELFGLTVVTAEAYGSPPFSREGVKSARVSLEHGNGAVVARDIATGTIVGAGTFPPIVHGLTEVAAIGVSVTHRRRGIAQALARRLAEEAHNRGAAYPFLMAAHEAEARIYQRAGFDRIGEILHISR